MISCTEFHSTRRFPTKESYLMRKAWKKARHFSKLSDSEILNRIEYEEGKPCLHCLNYGFDLTERMYWYDDCGLSNDSVFGLCSNHVLDLLIKSGHDIRE